MKNVLPFLVAAAPGAVIFALHAVDVSRTSIRGSIRGARAARERCLLAHRGCRPREEGDPRFLSGARQGTALAPAAWDELEQCPSTVTASQATELAESFIDRYRGGGMAPEASVPSKGGDGR